MINNKRTVLTAAEIAEAIERAAHRDRISEASTEERTNFENWIERTLSENTALDILALRAEVAEAKGVAGVCVNLFKGFQMLAEGKIEPKVFDDLVALSEKDLARGAGWLNEYVGALTSRAIRAEAALQSSLDHLDRRDNLELSYAVRPSDVAAWRSVMRERGL